MLSPLLQFVLLTHSVSAGVEFLGTATSYRPADADSDGSVTVALRSKLSSRRCTGLNWECLTGSCGNETAAVVNTVSEDEGESWCQTELISSRLVDSDAPFQLLLTGGNWTSSIQNGSLPFRAVTLVDLRRRSDTNRANSSPQTTVLPTVRVPSNCRRDFDLLKFDPDEDEVRCRFRNTPPSVLSVSPSCTLSFEPSGGDRGVFAVELLMEDFPRQNITLTQTSVSTERKTTMDAISRIPVQFALKVDPAVPSCSEGLYLPRFLPPTPANRAQLIAKVNQLLEINITAAVNNSRISKLLFSGPHNITVVTDRVQNTSGQFVLRWTPSESDAAATHPICFVVKAAHNGSSLQSDLRCVVVRVEPVTTTRAARSAFIQPRANSSTSPPLINSTSPGANTTMPSTSPPTTAATTPGANTTMPSTSPPPLINSTSPGANTTMPSTSPPPPINNTTPGANTTMPSTSPPPPINSTSPGANTTMPSTSPPPPINNTTPGANTTMPSTSPPPLINSTSPGANTTMPSTSPPTTAATTPGANTTMPSTSPPPPINNTTPGANTTMPSTSPPPPINSTSPGANTTMPSTSPPPPINNTTPGANTTMPSTSPLPPINNTTPATNTTILFTGPPPTAPISPTSPTTNAPPAYVVGLRVKISSLLHPSQIDTDAVLRQIQAALASQGLQLDFSLLSIRLQLDAGTTAPPAAQT